MRGSLRFVVTALVLTAAVALPASAMAAKKAAKKPVGVLYTETNSPKRNQVQIFHRFADGSLKFVKAVATGGTGGQQLQPGCAPTCPFLDTQGEVTLSSDGKLLFVVNAGSNSITSFRVKPGGGLQKADVKPSGGKFPNSITTHGNVLYVLDSGIFPMPGPPVPGNVQGFHFNAAGHLTPIKGSNRPLTATVPGLARQVGFNNKGTVLVATLAREPEPDAAGRHRLDRHVPDQRQWRGEPRDRAQRHDAVPVRVRVRSQRPPDHVAGDEPHGARRRRHRELQASPRPGALTPISTVASKGTAPCWVEISGNGKYAFVVNTGGGAPTGAFTTSYRIAPNGGLKFLANTPVRKGEFALTDEALSRDSKYLYVLAAAPPPTLAHHIDEYKVLGNGHLKFIGRTPDMAVPGTSGMAGL